MKWMKLASMMLAIATCFVAGVLVTGCNEQGSEPADLVSGVDNILSIKPNDVMQPLAAGADTWPRRLLDFKFPNRYGEAWKITCGYGCYKHQYTHYPHAGRYSVDLVRVYKATTGSCVLAPARGIVIFAGKLSGYGWCVIMDHDAGHTGLAYKSISAHFDSDPNQFVHVGDDLLAGTVLGYAGSSGTSSPHIHFSVWKDNVSVPLNDISGYHDLYQYGVYYSYNWPIQPPRGQPACYQNA